MDDSTTLTIAPTMTVHGQNFEIGPGNFDSGGTKALEFLRLFRSLLARAVRPIVDLTGQCRLSP